MLVTHGPAGWTPSTCRSSSIPRSARTACSAPRCARQRRLAALPERHRGHGGLPRRAGLHLAELVSEQRTSSTAGYTRPTNGGACARHDHRARRRALRAGIVARLARARHEAAEPRPWKMGDSAPAFIDGLLGHIVGIEIALHLAGRQVEAEPEQGDARSRGRVRGTGRARPCRGSPSACARPADQPAARASSTKRTGGRCRCRSRARPGRSAWRCRARRAAPAPRPSSVRTPRPASAAARPTPRPLATICNMMSVVLDGLRAAWASRPRASGTCCRCRAGRSPPGR